MFDSLLKYLFFELPNKNNRCVAIKLYDINFQTTNIVMKIAYITGWTVIMKVKICSIIYLIVSIIF